MSIDYYAYVRNMELFSTAKCEEYLLTLGIRAELYPDLDLFSHTGFLPFKLNGGFISDDLAANHYKSGFELQLNPYVYAPPTCNSKGLLGKLFKKNAAQQETPFGSAIKDSTHCFSMSCSSQDCFEILLAYAFAAYLYKDCGAILDDPQTGQFFSREKLVIVEVTAIIDELKNLYKDGQLLAHEFTEWQMPLKAKLTLHDKHLRD